MTLAFDREGRLLAGTESPGRVFQLDAAGKPFVLLDSPYNEIRALRVDANGQHLCGRGERPRRPAPSARRAGARPPAPQPSPRSRPRSRSIAIAPTPSAVGGQRGSTDAGAGRQSPARARSIASCPTAPRTSCGSRAKTRRMTSRSRPTAACSSPPATRARSIALPATRCSRRSSRAPPRSRSRRCCPTAPGGCCSPRRTPAKCSGCRATRADRGTYTSDVRDAQTVATWGAIKWQAPAPAGHEGRDLHALRQHADA